MEENLGIIDIQVYFPRYYISQYDLEEYDKVPHGKYTVGLGQINMSFVDDNEDINSLCMTVLDRLIKKNNISLNQISRIEVGTETLIDKSKSVKTNLMDLFKETNNNDIEGITVINACYGGISALLNTFNWMFSKFYDNKYAIVICGDVASYGKGPARPTGGCGTIGVLLGRGGSLMIENIRASFMKNAYDFYKPNPVSEYPTVDGHHSLDCYLEALYNCLENYINKKGNINYDKDYFGFHCPYSKLVEKAFYQLKCFQIYHNYNNNISEIYNYIKNLSSEVIKEINEKEGKFWKLAKSTQDIIKNQFNNDFKLLIEPGLFLCKQLGNLYTGSIFGFLLSLLLNLSQKNQSLVGSRIFLFSYGSGLASTLLVLDVDNEKYKKIINNNKDIFKRLNERIKITPFLYESILLKKEKLYLKNDYLPQGKTEDLFEGTFYLTKVDNLWKRYYNQKPYKENNNSNADNNNIANNNMNKSGNEKLLQTQNIWSGFRKKNIIERQLQIKKLYDNVDIEQLKTGGLNLLRADNLIENCIGVISLPIGLGLNFIINGQKYSIPMSTEEPSVIAAASYAAKIIGENGGFYTNCDSAYMIAQIMYEFDSKIKNNPKDKNYFLSQTSQIINRNKAEIIKYGNNNICNKMYQRGGGIVDIYIRNLKNQNSNFFSVEIIVNCLEAMGANLLNDIAEKMSKYLSSQKYILQKPILRVLSNLCIYRKATSEFKIDVSSLSSNSVDGYDLANLIVKANLIAKDDPFRASTHNKGIMNGIDAVAIALGQDFRAIEAGVHAYASIDPNNYNYSNYRPLTDYEIITINNKKYLYGKLTLPIAVGTVGGVINSNIAYENNMKLLGKPNSEQLCQIMVSVGLAQNFAALRALVSEGIQKGHISLHAKNIAYRAGTPDHLIGDVVNFMKSSGSINEDTAKKYLESIQLYSKIRKKNGKSENGNYNKNKLSNFFIDVNFNFLKYPIKMNILINSKITPEINFKLLATSANSNDNNNDERINIISNDLFGKKQKSVWLYEFMTLIHSLDLFKNTLQEIYQIKYKVKLCVILFFTLTNNLLKIDSKEGVVSNFIVEMLKEKYINGNFESLFNLIPESDSNKNISLEFGMTVILELYEIYLFYIDNYLTNKKHIMNLIKKEVNQSLNNFVRLKDYKNNKKINSIQNFEEYFELRLTRLNGIVLLLIDYGFSNEHYTEEEIKNFICLGRYSEIQITLYRDFAKVKNYTEKSFNSYKIFQNFLNEKGIHDNKIIKEKYFKIKDKEIEQLTENIKKININGENGLTIKEKIDKKLKMYYSETKLNEIKL